MCLKPFDDDNSLRRRIAAEIYAASAAVAFRADHIHAHFLGMPSIAAYYLSSYCNVPYSLSAHAWDIYVGTTPSRVLEAAKFRVACTRKNQLFLNERYRQAPFHLIRHGLDLTTFGSHHQYEKNGACRILAVGRLVEKKGFRYLIEACDLLARKGFRFFCTIAGAGPELPALKAMVRSADLESCFSFVGLVPHSEVIRQYQAHDMLVVPSVVASGGDMDGVPNVILEAMASGLPVIATDAGSIGEAVRDQLTGMMVPQADAKALADAIMVFWNDARFRKTVAAAAREVVQKEFGSDVWLRRLHDLFSAS
jgi:glycosyltransferase involved in cell wall biosynthesis